MGEKILLAIRKSDGAVVSQVQSGPRAPIGKRVKQAMERYGGSEEDYFEYLVEDDAEVASVLNAKELRWDRLAEGLRATPFSGAEQQERERSMRQQALEAEMIREQADLDAAEKLGLDTTERTAKIDNLKAEYEKLKEKKNG